jgi:deoxyinosine 3'endonuclease (endonuclease V)
MEKNPIPKKSKKTKYEEILSHIPESIISNWTEIQNSLKQKQILTDSHTWTPSTLSLIGGMDISFSKKDPSYAVSALIICDSNLKCIYEKYQLVKMTEPYVPGFLAFREVNHLTSLLNSLKKESPDKIPEIILCDGNGILHPKHFGIACHLGVLEDIPTIGCSKNVFATEGITDKKVKELARSNLKKKGDYVELKGNNNEVLALAVRSSDESINPIIVSIGHRVGNQTALEVFNKCTIFRVPEPIRLADKMSRRIVKYYEDCGFKEFDIEKYVKEHREELHFELDN